jgi:carboxymethylenebutenolidase
MPTVAWAEKNGGDTSRLAATGFGWGGRIIWLYAAHSDALKAGAAWYGRLAGATTSLQPKNPVEIAGDLKAPVIGLYGGKDQGISLETVELMWDALKVAGRSSEIHVYTQAQHGFNADYRPSYDPAAAKDAWAKMLAFFRARSV